MQPRIFGRADWSPSPPLRRAGLSAVALFAISCGSPVTKPPVTGVLAVSSVSPSTLSTTGGATVTISGTGFGTDTTVKLDGASVTDVTATSTTITFTAPTHTAGTGAFAVATGGKTGSVNATFVAPTGTNAVPVITNLRVTGPGSKPPSPFADLASSVALSATVTDLETSPASLTYAWTVGAGTVTGTGASVSWSLPATMAVTPSAVTATLTVTETFTEGGVQHRNLATASFLVDAHDSSTEVLDKGFRFLDLFSQSSVPAATVVSDFESTCGGATEELDDTVANRQTYLYTAYTITRLPPVTFNFGGSCPDPKGNPRGDACTSYQAHWVARVIQNSAKDDVTVGQVVTTDGRDYIGNVFRNGQWKLCSSHFQGTTVVSSGTSGIAGTRVIPTPQSMVPGRIKKQ